MDRLLPRSRTRIPWGAALLASIAVACGTNVPAAWAWLPPEPGQELGCTVVEPTRHLTLEVTIPDSYEFCPLLARALSEDVLDVNVGITFRRWHYPVAQLSCRLS
jgi:hypothetical protein